MEREVTSFAPVVVIGGEVPGWIADWGMKHRGVGIWAYGKRGHEGNDAACGVHNGNRYRSKGEYTTRTTLKVLEGEEAMTFMAEDLGTKGRGDGEGSLDR